MKILETLRTAATAIQQLRLPAGEHVNLKPREHEIWILVEGSMVIREREKQNYDIQQGQIFFLPQGKPVHIDIQTPILYWKLQIPLIKTWIEYYFHQGLTRKKGPVQTGFNPIPLKGSLCEYIRHLQNIYRIDNTLLTLNGIFIHQFFYHLKASCSDNEIADLLYPVIDKEDPFVLFVIKHYKQVKNLTQLAYLSNHSRRSFETRFKKRFGIPPGQWLLRHKIENIRREIVKTDTPFTLIADQYGFNTLSNLTDFCKKYLGSNPSELRKGGKKRN